MLLLLTTYPNKPRDLKKFILGLIKSEMAICVQRIQYVKSYYMREGKLEQQEEKILLIKHSLENKAKIQAFFTKNHPYKVPEMIRVKPEDINEAYAQWAAKKT